MNPISIYIVEDELLISASLKSQLEQFGYEISGSSIRGEVCLEDIEALSMQGREPEIVLMDIHLRGELDGIETAKRLNEKFNCAIIFLTGQSSKEIYERSFKIKPFGYLLKPIDMEQTKMTIEIASYQRNLEIQNTLYRKDLEALLEKRSQENRELMAMYQTLVDNSLMGLTIMQEGKIIYSNHQTARIFGYPLEEFMKLTTWDVMNMTHPEDRARVMSYTNAKQPGDNETIVTRVRMFSRDKQLKHIETHIKQMEYKGKPAFHHIFIDLTSFLAL
jgi:PAS domain S-box-containing protein